MTKAEQNLSLLAALALLALLLWLLLRKKTVAATPAAAGVSTSVTSQMVGWQPTQLGMPAAAIAALDYEQILADVAYWIDPASGMPFAASPNYLGAVPLVALTDPVQISQWYQLNLAAVADMDAGTVAPIAG